MAEIKVEVKVYCAHCKCDLEWGLEVDEDGDLQVEPCRICEAMIKLEGWEEGQGVGYAEGLDVGRNN